MTKRHQLLKVNVPEIIVVEILGPRPPNRVEAYSPTTARIKVVPYLTKEAEITQDQDSILSKSATASKPVLFEETAYDFIVEIKDENAQARAFSMLISGKKPADKPKRIWSTNAYTSQINFGSQIGYVDLEFF